MTLALSLTDDALEAIAERVAAILEARRLEGPGMRLNPWSAVARGGAAAAGRFLTVAEAADYLRAKPQRIYDLLSTHRLTRFKDGRRVLLSRAELDAHLASATGSSRVAPALPPTLRSRSHSGLGK